MHHVREVDADQHGPQKNLMTGEYWYADDLRMNFASRLDDPQAALQTMTVTHLTRKEPDAAIYQISAAYRRVDTLSQIHTAPQ